MESFLIQIVQIQVFWSLP